MFFTPVIQQRLKSHEGSGGWLPAIGIKPFRHFIDIEPLLSKWVF
jgi:hypothetical protein